MTLLILPIVSPFTTLLV